MSHDRWLQEWWPDFVLLRTIPCYFVIWAKCKQDGKKHCSQNPNYIDYTGIGIWFSSPPSGAGSIGCFSCRCLNDEFSGNTIDFNSLSPAGNHQPRVLLSPTLHSTQLFLLVFPKPHGLVNQVQIIYVLWGSTKCDPFLLILQTSYAFLASAHHQRGFSLVHNQQNGLGVALIKQS